MVMLQLQAEQLAQVEALQRQRQAAGLAQVLAQAWPEVAERLQTRWPDFVTAALTQGHERGLQAPAELARHACLGCLWGLGYETRPGFEWALEILGDARRPPALQLHQLLQRSGLELARRAASAGAHATPGIAAGVPPERLARALADLEAGLATVQRGRDLFLDLPAAPPLQACDVDTLALQAVDAQPLLGYQLQDGHWTRAELPRLPPQTAQHAEAPPVGTAMPLLSHPAGAGPTARLQVLLQAQGRCSRHPHPELVLEGPQGPLRWQGADAARLSLPLPVLAPEAPAQGLPGVGWAPPPEARGLAVHSCGVRDAGAPFGEVQLALPVYTATQALAQWRHGPAPALGLPGAAAAAAPAAWCRLETDGQQRDTAPWLQAWNGLHGQCRAGLEKLFNTWARVMAEGTARLDAELSPLMGQAGITWGWRRTGPGAVGLHTQAELDWVALALNLQLSGELLWAGARAQVQLQAQAHEAWQCSLPAGPADPEAPPWAQARHTWRVPLQARLVAVASGEPAMLSALRVPEPLQGALVGECGLRPRPDGQGWQWFYRLALEAAHLALCCSDPLLGEQQRQLELLPAMTLVDWSAG